MHRKSKGGKTKVLYLMCLEPIYNYGIFHSQVKMLLFEMMNMFRDKIDIVFMAILPLVHISKKGVDIIPIKHHQSIKNLRRELSQHGIRSTIMYVPLPRMSIYLNLILFPIFIIFTLPIIAVSILRHQFDVIHCRSYLPALMAALIKKLSINVKIIFDTRAPVPEQGVIAGHYKRTSMLFKLWKLIERFALKSSDTILAVTEQFAEELKKSSRNMKMEVIYNCVNMEDYKMDHCKIKELRHAYDLPDKTIIVYNGSLGVWNDPELMVRIFHTLLSVRQDVFFLVLTTFNVEKLKSIFEKHGIFQKNFRIMRLEPRQVPTILPLCDYGLWPSRDFDTTYHAERIHATVTGIKTLEYLAAGLPLIANSNMDAIKYLINKYDLGMTFEMMSLDKMHDDFLKLEVRQSEVRKNCTGLADILANVNRQAVRYAMIYRGLKQAE